MSLDGDDLALLCLQIEWGADEALLPDPLDRLRPRPSGPAPHPGRPDKASPDAPPNGAHPDGNTPPDTVRGTTPRGAPGGGAGGAPAGAPGGASSASSAQAGAPAERALAAAAGAADLAALRAAIAGFDGCHLRDTAAHLVFAEGDADSPILLIGDPPGREEDRTGHPFAGAEGRLLDQMLASIGLQRGQLLLTPLIPWRPPGERLVSAGELALLLPFLHRLIALQAPQRIVIFGATAARALLQRPPPRRRAQVDWAEIRIPTMQKSINTIALPSLAEMLKNPPSRRDAWTALRRLRRALDQIDGVASRVV